MADVHTVKTRSYNMSQIRSKDTKPELVVRKILFANGFRFRIHVRNLPGKPDIVLKKYNTVIFVNGCFWHGHKGCKYFKIPGTRTEWWLGKINRNKELDKVNSAALRKAGWRVITINECQLKGDKIDKTLKNLIKRLKTLNPI